MTQEFRVGVIAKPHGVHGEVNVFPTTQDPARFRELKEVILAPPRGERRTLTIDSVKFVSKFVVLKFHGIDTVEDVERWRSGELFVTRDNATPLAEGEYYVADVIGLKVLDADSGEELGHITDVIETGANDVYEMRRSDGRTAMLPAIKDCVKRISIEEGFMEIHVMKGLFD
ncbi:MAG: ribosome maturation factor RimM [Lachnospiraceae bacterium]|nr:ribosome maturation factor RimM [Lachnospiraceae bacterium]